MLEVNPLKQIRLKAHYSLERLSEEAHISRQTIINNENGQYENPSPALLSALVIITDLDLDQISYRGSKGYRDKPWLDTIISDYHRWQVARRRESLGVLIEPLPKWDPHIKDEPHSLVHPVGDWAAKSNIPYTRISKLYCVHQAVMDRLKNKPNLCNHLPNIFTDALIVSGYSLTETILPLEERFQKYKQLQRDLITLRNGWEVRNNNGSNGTAA